MFVPRSRSPPKHPKWCIVVAKSTCTTLMMRRRSHAARRVQKGRELKRIRLPGRMAPIQRGFACLRTNLSIAQQNISIRESYDTSSGTPAGVDFPDLELRSTFAVWERGRLERHPRLLNGRHPLWETILLLVLNLPDGHSSSSGPEYCLSPQRLCFTI